MELQITINSADFPKMDERQVEALLKALELALEIAKLQTKEG